MNSVDVFSLFRSVNVRKTEDKYSLYKPLLLLYSLLKCYAGEQKLIEFSEIEIELSNIVNKIFEDLEYKKTFTMLLGD